MARRRAPKRGRVKWKVAAPAVSSPSFHLIEPSHPSSSQPRSAITAGDVSIANSKSTPDQLAFVFPRRVLVQMHSSDFLRVTKQEPAAAHLRSKRPPSSTSSAPNTCMVRFGWPLPGISNETLSRSLIVSSPGGEDVLGTASQEPSSDRSCAAHPPPKGLGFGVASRKLHCHISLGGSTRYNLS